MKNIILIFLIATAVASFKIKTDETPSPGVSTLKPFEGIPWPFNVCGEGDWTVESLTLGQTPKRNINDDITSVLIKLYYRLELQKPP